MVSSQLCVVRRSAGVSSKAAAAGAAVTQRAAAGRPKRCGTSHAHIWASNAGQDTTLDTLSEASDPVLSGHQLMSHALL